MLHINAGNLYGGIETFLVTLARERGLCPDMEPHFALCFAGRLSKTLESCGVSVHPLGNVRISRPWTVWRARRRFRALLRANRFDVAAIHGCWQHALFAPVARAHGLPLVFFGHNIQSGRDWLDRWAQRTEPDLIIANGRATQPSLVHLFPTAKNEINHYPVQSIEWTDRQAIRNRLRGALGAPPDAAVIIQTCRLERWKGQTLLLQALAGLADVSGWVCWIAGGAQRPQEAKYLTELRQAVDRAGISDRVRFLGQRSDVTDLLAAADIHCQPNTGPEPFGIAFVEALYAGLPVVTTAMGGAVEIVDETCGVLTPPADVEALRAALQRLIADPDERTRLGSGGPDRARTMCDPQRSLRRLYELFASLRTPTCVKQNAAAVGA